MKNVILGSFMLAALSLPYFKVEAGGYSSAPTAGALVTSAAPGFSSAALAGEFQKSDAFVEEAIFHLSNSFINEPSELMSYLLNSAKGKYKGMSDLELLNKLLEEKI
jgi:hypothetical protein